MVKKQVNDMSKEFTGACLCGAIKFAVNDEPSFQANCHCDECRRAGGGVYGSLAFVREESLSITQGNPASYEHLSDRGNTMTKQFCRDCGSQLFAWGSGITGRRGIRIGVIDDASWFKPNANVYSCRKLPSTPLDPEVTAFDKMPG